MAPTATITSYEYAAGTCTLRLVGELSPLSQVTDRPVLGRSRFTLQVRGDDQSAAANQAVMFEASGREPQFSTLANLVQGYVQHHLSAAALGSGEAMTQGANALQPVGLTRHRLTLAPDSGSPIIVELSTLQLADLADALEQAEGNLQILPDGVMPKARRVRPKLPIWLGSVAAVGIAALLGNQLLTTAPGPVVLSPGESQPLNGAADSASPEERQFSLEEAAPGSTADSATEPAAESAATGEALPEPATTAPTGPAAPASGSGSAEAPKISPPTPGATPAPEARSPQVEPSPAASPQAAARLARPDANAELAPAPESAPAPPSASPDAFDASPSIAATSAPDTALAWISNLTQALEQQWRPPSNLAAALRYRLTLDPDGTVTALEPLNDFSVTYQTNATLPQPGDTIPGVARDTSIIVEVQFLPTGEVVVVPPEDLGS